MGDRRYLDDVTGADIDQIVDRLDGGWSRLDRLCVIAAGVAHGYQFERYLLKDAVEDVATISRAILAKLEEEESE